jgi:hypothetical protein
MLPSREPDTHHSYLLRLWRTNQQAPHLHVSLRDARTGEIYHFANLNQLQEFLTRMVGGDESQQSPQDDSTV